MVGDAALVFGRNAVLGKHQTNTTPASIKEKDAHMNTGRGGRIDVLTLGEQTRGNGNGTSEAEPSEDRPQVCEWCGKGFKQVAKHRWRCKLRPQDGPQTVRAADSPIDAVTAERGQLRKSERKSCPELNHSATTAEACLASFSTKDQPPEEIELFDTVKLSLPQANRKNEWKGIDEDLSFAVRNIVKGREPGKELETFELTVYEYLADRYKTQDRKPYLKKPRKEGPETKTLRERKRETAQNFRTAVREDGVTSEGAKAARIQYWKLVRMHNKSILTPGC